MENLLQVYKNDYAQAFFDKQKGIFFWCWQPATWDMSDEEYKSTVLAGRDVFVGLPVKFFVVDSRKMQYAITPDFQVWYLGLITPIAIEKNIKKVAVLMSEELIIQLVSQLIEMDSKEARLPFMIKNFSQEDEALHWLVN